MFNSSSKKERRLGTPLFLKPFRSATGKAAMARRPGKPGQHGQARTRRGGSEFGKQLAEKQKIQFTYGIRDSQMRIIFKKASKSLSTTGPLFVSLLERRLDNVVYRLGIAPSRSVARQIVGHGHIQVNGKRVNIPSCQTKVGDVIAIRPQSKEYGMFKDLADRLKKADAPNWLTLNPETATGTVKMLPKDIDTGFDISLVVDYYSKLVK
jgi:small subunit ribosomal protein S4